ncbi:MAG TPA: hypothetical protein VF516_11130 [Kofleriaceae bacterium]
MQRRSPLLWLAIVLWNTPYAVRASCGSASPDWHPAMRDINVGIATREPMQLRGLARSAGLAARLQFASGMQGFRALCVSWIALAGAGSAWADEPSPPPPPPVTSVDHSITIATNLPFLWAQGYSIAGSVSVNLSAHHAIRANVASWQYDNIVAGLHAAEGGGDFVPGDGRTTDIALSWVFYPRRLWDGFLLEVGALHRSRDVTWKDDDDLASFPFTERRTRMDAGRVMIGWSWRINPYLFIATAVGLSDGWEVGSEAERRADGSTARTTPIAQQAGSLEGYLRFGGVIEL